MAKLSDQIKAFQPQPDVVDASIRSNITTGGDSYFITALAQTADDAPYWWTQQRDDFLRDFYKSESVLSGAIYSMIAKAQSWSWKLDGPRRQVTKWQEILASSEMGRGFHVLLSKVILDFLTQDKGAFIELIREAKWVPDNTGGLIAKENTEGPIIGMAHIDAKRCQLTGDYDFPVLYRNPYGGELRKLRQDQIIHLASMPSADETKQGIGLCATSRALRSAQIIRDIAQHKREKISSNPKPGMVIVNGITKKQLQDAFVEYGENNANAGLTRYAGLVFLASMDLAIPMSINMVDFASLPDGYNEQESMTLYIYVLALCFGVDAREFWPATASGATKADATVQAQKARGKGPGEIITAFQHALNWKVLPESVTFRFDVQDDEEDQTKAVVRKTRAEERKLRVESGEITPTQALLLAIESGDAPPEWAPAPESDITVDEVDDATNAEPEAPDIEEPVEPPTKPDTLISVETQTAEKKTAISGLEVRALSSEIDYETDLRKNEAKIQAFWQDIFNKQIADFRRSVGVKAMQKPLPQDDDYWKNQDKTVAGKVTKYAVDPAFMGAKVTKQALTMAGFAVDMNRIDEAMRKYVSNYPFTVVPGINETTRDAMRGVWDDWLKTGLDKKGLGSLIKGLEPVLGSRAEIIGITETTRLFEEARYEVRKASQVINASIWTTARDDFVCRFCRPLNGEVTHIDTDFQAVEDGVIPPDKSPKIMTAKHPPLHPRCRCETVDAIIGEGKPMVLEPPQPVAQPIMPAAPEKEFVPKTIDPISKAMNDATPNHGLTAEQAQTIRAGVYKQFPTPAEQEYLDKLKHSVEEWGTFSTRDIREDIMANLETGEFKSPHSARILLAVDGAPTLDAPTYRGLSFRYEEDLQKFMLEAGSKDGFDLVPSSVSFSDKVPREFATMDPDSVLKRHGVLMKFEKGTQGLKVDSFLKDFEGGESIIQGRFRIVGEPTIELVNGKQHITFTVKQVDSLAGVEKLSRFAERPEFKPWSPEPTGPAIHLVHDMGALDENLVYSTDKLALKNFADIMEDQETKFSWADYFDPGEYVSVDKTRRRAAENIGERLMKQNDPEL